MNKRKKRVDPIGHKYGKLTVVAEHSKTRNGHYRYVCECECGNTANVLLTHLRQGNTKSCGCDRPTGKARKDWTGVGEISGNFWHNHVVRSANGTKGRREIEMTIDKEYMWALFLNQDRKCALSGLELTLPKKWNDKSYTASVDRIDSGKGYIPGNVQWLHKDINIMKNKFSNDYFITMCKAVSGSCELVY